MGTARATFALPDLRGRVPVHQGNGLVLAETGGVEQVTLTTQQIPAHNHPLVGSAANASATSPVGAVPGTMPEVATSAYGSDAPLTSLSPQSISPVGGSQPHENMQPFLCVDFIISLFGIFPSPN